MQVSGKHDGQGIRCLTPSGIQFQLKECSSSYVTAIKSLVLQHDVMLPTGYGKSLIFIWFLWQKNYWRMQKLAPFARYSQKRVCSQASKCCEV